MVLLLSSANYSNRGAQTIVTWYCTSASAPARGKLAIAQECGQVASKREYFTLIIFVIS